MEELGPLDRTGAHAELVAVVEAWAAAIVSNDAERIDSFMASDWEIVSESGVSSREDFLSLVASGELTHSAMDLVGEARVRLYGDAAVVTGRVTNTAHHLGRRFDADEWTSDVFVRRDGRWLCVLSHITPVAQAAADHGSTRSGRPSGSEGDQARTTTVRALPLTSDMAKKSTCK